MKIANKLINQPTWNLIGWFSLADILAVFLSILLGVVHLAYGGRNRHQE